MSGYLENTVPASATDAQDWARKHTSPRGKLADWLPDLLDERRVELAIPDPVFTVEAVYDRILLWQITQHQGDTYVKGGKIVMSEIAKAREKEQAPVGIIVSAGMVALDHLRSNGMDLGHAVMFVRLSPWRPPIEMPDGQQVRVVCCRTGDICGSMELPAMRAEGKAKTVVEKTEDGESYHVVRLEGDTSTARPEVPAIGEEY